MALTNDAIEKVRDNLEYIEPDTLSEAINDMEEATNNDNYKIFAQGTPRGTVLDEALKKLSTTYNTNIDIEIRKILSDLKTFLQMQEYYNNLH